MRQKFNLISVCCMVLSVLLPVLPLAADDDFDQAMVSYSALLEIMDQMKKGDEVFALKNESQENRKGLLEFKDSERYEIAQKNKINEHRVKLIGNMFNKINEQIKNNEGFYDKAVKDIMEESLDGESGDLMISIALCSGLKKFINTNDYKQLFKKSEVKKEARNNLAEYENDILEKLQECFADEDLKELVKKYQELYPDEELLLTQTAPAQIMDIYTVFDHCIRSFRNLNRYSAVADFRLWGKNMLNVLVLDKNPEFIKEFNRHLDNHKRAFK